MTDTERTPNLLGEHVPETRVEATNEPRRETLTQPEIAPSIAPASEPVVSEPRHEAVPVSPPAVPQDPMIAAIEAAMAKGRVMEIYATLPAADQEKFRISGEAVAAQLRTVLGTPRFHYRKSWSAIREWLHTLPGKDRSFLEQETNIVYNRVAKMHEEQRSSPPRM